MREDFGVQAEEVICTEVSLYSTYLQRVVIFDIYTSTPNSTTTDLLLINDGQDIRKMNFAGMLEMVPSVPLVCVAIHCATDRIMEYGTICRPDFVGRGAKAPLYSRFIIEELLPYIHSYLSATVVKTSFAGFSLGGLSALDITWNFPQKFSMAAVFSGSLWWRKRNYDDPEYNWATDRIMHSIIKQGTYQPNLRFFFESGHLDESADRNNNGIIDSVEDTRDLIHELKQLGYTDQDIYSLELPDGRHDVATWEKALPVFLNWVYGR